MRLQSLLWISLLLLGGLAACDSKRVHVDVVADVLVNDPATVPVAGTLVTFRSVKIVDGEELGRSQFTLSKSTGSDGHASFTVGYNVTTDEAVLLEASTGNGTNLQTKRISGTEIHGLAALTDLGIAVVTPLLILVECPQANPDYCGGTCRNVKHDKEHCGKCGHACAVDCLDGSCIPCSSAVGTWTITGDCPTKECTVTQDTCGGSIVCTKADGSKTDPATINAGDGTLNFEASLGSCDIKLTGNTFNGECGTSLISCSVSGTRSSW